MHILVKFNTFSRYRKPISQFKTSNAAWEPCQHLFSNESSNFRTWGSSMRKIRSNRDMRVWGSMMFSMMVFFGFHWDSQGLAAASTDVRAFNWQMMPALATDSVCCSITSCSMDLRTKGKIRHYRVLSVSSGVSDLVWDLNKLY